MSESNDDEIKKKMLANKNLWECVTLELDMLLGEGKSVWKEVDRGKAKIAVQLLQKSGYEAERYFYEFHTDTVKWTVGKKLIGAWPSAAIIVVMMLGILALGLSSFFFYSIMFCH